MKSRQLISYHLWLKKWQISEKGERPISSKIKPMLLWNALSFSIRGTILTRRSMPSCEEINTKKYQWLLELLKNSSRLITNKNSQGSSKLMISYIEEFQNLISRWWKEKRCIGKPSPVQVFRQKWLIDLATITISLS